MIQPSNEKDLLTLRRRAHDLAQPLQKEEIEENHHLEILVFFLANESFAIETQYLKEVFPLNDITPLPGAPSFLYGLVNFRRKIIAVIDLRVLFNLSTDNDGTQKLILLSDQDREFAIVTNGIDGIQCIPEKTIDQTPPTMLGLRQELLQGITESRIAILDGRQLLTCQQLVIDDAVEASK